MLFTQKLRIAENDLSWYFNESSSDVGIKSNWNSMVSVACFGASTNFQDTFSSFILLSVERLRKIESLFYSLSLQSQKVLYLYFAYFNFPHPYLKATLRELAPLTILNPQFHSFELVFKRFSLGLASDKDKLLISSSRIDARTALFSAVNEFYKIKIS